MTHDPFAAALAMELHAAAGDLALLGMVLTAVSVVFLLVLLVADHLPKPDPDAAVELALGPARPDTDMPQAA